MMGSFKQVFLLLTHSLAIEVDTESPDLNRDREDKIPRLQHVTWDAPHSGGRSIHGLKTEEGKPLLPNSSLPPNPENQHLIVFS